MARVLVVDDDPSIRQVIALALADEGHEVDEASDGRRALECIAAHHPDIMLVDLKMPGMDGRTFVKTYRARFAHRAAIIVLTAAQEHAVRGQDLDVEAALLKPFDLGDLLAQMERILRQRAEPATGEMA